MDFNKVMYRFNYLFIKSNSQTVFKLSTSFIVNFSSAKTPLTSTWRLRPSGRRGNSHLTSFINAL